MEEVNDEMSPLTPDLFLPSLLLGIPQYFFVPQN